MAQDEGKLTSPTLMALIRAAVARHLSGAVEPDADKTTLLARLCDEVGLRAVLAVGFGIDAFANQPVLDAMAAGGTPIDVLERWMRLERFGHTRNRTRLMQAAEVLIVAEHVALDGGVIHPVNDLFIWGLLIALMRRAGFGDLEARLRSDEGEVCVYREGELVGLGTLPPHTGRLVMAWASGGREEDSSRSHRGGAPHEAAPALQGATAPGDSAHAGKHLHALFRTDLLKSWRVADAARALAMSTRQLQRALGAEQTSFSEALQRTRVEAARAMMSDTALSLTEIAYCTGFSDAAHFSRLFRRYHDIPPSALRGLLR